MEDKQELDKKQGNTILPRSPQFHTNHEDLGKSYTSLILMALVHQTPIKIPKVNKNKMKEREKEGREGERKAGRQEVLIGKQRWEIMAYAEETDQRTVHPLQGGGKRKVISLQTQLSYLKLVFGSFTCSFVLMMNQLSGKQIIRPNLQYLMTSVI